jgi:endonuclease VIII-like 1
MLSSITSCQNHSILYLRSFPLHLSSTKQLDMPEISEVRIMSEFINNVASKVDYFVGISKNPEHKSKTNLNVPFEHFQLKAFSRGKELMLRFTGLDFSYGETEAKNLVFTMGMSGNWNYSKDIFSIPKHTHLTIVDCDGGVLGMHDVRRFARWDWRSWNPERGHDPVQETELFRKDILENLMKDKIFQKPIYEAMMNQKYFNGVGNYLRAEILGRIDLDPRLSAGDYIIQAGEKFFNMTEKIIVESYILGGGQFKDWYNQADLEKKKSKEFQAWMQFYFNKERCEPIKDKHDRNFWMDKKWINDK